MRKPLSTVFAAILIIFSVHGTARAAIPEVVELARALWNDPDLIYQYVYNNIETLPQYASLKGPLGTIVDRKGTAFDQAELMFELLKQGGYLPTYQFGNIHLTATELSNWLGTDTARGSVEYALGQGNFPGIIYGDPVVTGADLHWAWVSVPINGTTYVFNPGLKTYDWTSPIDVAAAMGYSHSSFIADAQSGASISNVSLSLLNRTNIRNDLAGYANNLINYIRTNSPIAATDDILGGKTIDHIPTTTRLRQTSLPNLAAVPGITSGSTMPDFYRMLISISMLKVNNPGYNTVTFRSSDIYGNRLSIFFNASNQPVLYLNGASAMTGKGAAGTPAVASVLVALSYPNAPAGLNWSFSLLANPCAYVIATGFGPVSRGMVERHRKLLQQNMLASSTPVTEAKLGETMAMLGYEWMAEKAGMAEIIDRLSGTNTIFPFSVGFVGMKPVTGSLVGPVIDLPINLVTPTQLAGRPNSQTPSATEFAAFNTMSHVNSVLESGVIEQTQPGIPAVSTVKLQDIAIASPPVAGGLGTIFDINNGLIVSGSTVNNSAYYTSTIKPMLLNNGYLTADVNRITSLVNAGHRVIAPKRGNIIVNSWTGTGYFDYSGQSGQGSIGAIITGGLSGGFGTIPEPATTFQTFSTFTDPPPSSSFINTTFSALGGYSSKILDRAGDPVNIVTGDYLYEHTDLSLGSGKEFPYLLEFIPSYDSGRASQAGTIGLGWKHNFNISANQDSDGFEGMGVNSPINAAAAIAASYVMKDILLSSGTIVPLQNIVMGVNVAQWLMEKLTNNVVNVVQPGKAEQFVKLPDGSYNPPLGSASQLTGAPGSYVYTAKDKTALTFNSAGHLATWHHPSGPTVTFAYNGSNQLTSVNNGMGRVLTLGYTSNRVTSVADGTGRSVAYTYDSTGNLATYRDALNSTTTFNYDLPGRLTKIFYPSRPTSPFIINGYDSLGRMQSQTDANGNVTWFDFAGSMSATASADGGHFYFFSPRGKTLQEWDEIGNQSFNEYDNFDRLTKATAAEGNSTAYTYDSKHNVLTVTNNPKTGSSLSPTVRSFTYDPTYNKVLTATDADGNTTTNTYDAATGNLIAINLPTVPNTTYVFSPPSTLTGTDHPSTPHQSFTYNTRGQLLTATDALGKVTLNTYDAGNENMLSTYDDYGRFNILNYFSYDSPGNLISKTDPRGNVTTYAYDALRRVTQITGPASTGAVTKYAYDADSNLLNTKRATGLAAPNDWQTTSTAYSPSFKALTETDAAGNVTTTTYDVMDRKASMTDAENRQTLFGYDHLGHLISVKNLAIQSTPLVQHSFTPNGKEAALTDARGNVTNYAYDGLDRLSQMTFPGGSFEGYAYDPNNNMVSKVMRNGLAITYVYDPLNRMTRKIAAPKTIGDFFTYDDVGHLVDAGNSINHVLYTYDTAGRKASEATNSMTTSYSYDASSNRTALTYASPAYAVTYEYDALDRMTIIRENGSAALVIYFYDPLSRRTRISYGNSAFALYGYGANNDVISLSQTFSGTASVAFTYTYNKVHQRTGVDVSDANYLFRPSAAVSIAYAPNALNQYSTAGSATLSYDANGNLTGDAAHVYQYDTENWLQFIDPTGSNFAYTPDGLGRRQYKYANVSLKETYIYDGDREIEIQPQSPPNAKVRIIYGPGLDEPAVTMPDAVNNTGLKNYVHTDGLGSTIALTDPSGAVVDRFAYSPFGESASIAGFPSRFTGRHLDSDLGIYSYRARTYSPTLGRFLQPDPIGTSGGVNLYAYVNNDPLNLTDPSGLMANQAFKFSVASLQSISDGMRNFDPGVLTDPGAYMSIHPALGGLAEGAALGARAFRVGAGAAEAAGGAEASGGTYLYQKVGATGEHLKFGITKNPLTRYTQEELGGGRIKLIAQGPRNEMLQLERSLHETLPIGSEEGQSFYIRKQVEKGLIPPPYGGAQ